MNQRTGTGPRDVSVPFMDGDVLNFAVPENGVAPDILIFHPATVQNGRNIGEWHAVRTIDGRELSHTQLSRRANGLGLVGDNADERLRDFLTILQERGTLTIRVARSRVQPSTRPEWNGTRVITFDAIARNDVQVDVQDDVQDGVQVDVQDGVQERARTNNRRGNNQAK